MLQGRVFRHAADIELAAAGRGIAPLAVKQEAQKVLNGSSDVCCEEQAGGLRLRSRRCPRTCGRESDHLGAPPKQRGCVQTALAGIASAFLAMTGVGTDVPELPGEWSSEEGE